MGDFASNFRGNTKKFGFIFLTIFALLISMISPYITVANAYMNENFETLFGDKINVQQAPIVEVIGDNTQIPKDYEFVMKTTEKTSVKIFGSVKGAKTYQTNVKAYPSDNPAANAGNLVTAIPLEKNAPGSFGAIYENVGTYKGKAVNVRMTIVDYSPWVYYENPYRPHVYINSKQMGINAGGADVQVRYEFLDAETGKVINVKGIFSIADIDAWQGVQVLTTPTNPLKVYMTKNSPLKYSNTPYGFGIFSDKFDENANGINGQHPDHIATVLFDSNAVEFSYFQDRFAVAYQPPYRAITEVTVNGKTFKAGDLVALNYVQQWRQENPKADLEKVFLFDGMGYTDINIGASYFEISANKPLRTEIAPPTKVVSDTDEFEVKENTISKKDELFTYTVEHFVPAEYSRYVYQSYEFTDDLEDVLSVENVRITNELGMDVTHYFDISVDAQSSKVTAKAKTAILKLDNNPITTFYNHSYFFEVDAKIKNGANLSPYYKNGIAHVPNKATVAVDGAPYVSNDVITKINPSIFADDVQIKKSVNGKLNYTLKDAKETFRYGISATIPPTVGSDGYTITDQLESVLSYLGNAKVILSKGSSVSGNVGNQLQVQGSNLSFALTPQQLSQYAGGEISIEFDAQIRDGADLSKYKQKEIPTIPNSASILWDGMKFDSNRVNVQVPIFDKKVNGENHIDLTKKDQIFNYEIATVVPDNVTSLVVTDTLVNVLKFTDPSTIFVNMDAQVSVKDQTLTVTLDEKTIAENVGKPLHISFTSNVRENADLTPYIEQGYKVPNTATINIDGHNVKTNTVTVKPPRFEKKVDGKDHVSLGSDKDTFTYTVDTTVPNGIKELVMLDELEGVLDVVSTKLVNVSDNETIKDVTPQTNGNIVTVTMNESETAKYANKTIQLQIVAKIKDGADLTTYKDNIVPNKAVLFLDKQRITSNEVTVKTPYVDKRVNGVKDYSLLTKDEIVDYTIKTTIPSSAESFTISDKLMQELEIVGKPSFSIDGITPTVNGNSVEVKMNKQQVQANANKDVVLTIKARIVEGADLSAYKDEKIPNKAVIKNDGKTLETPTVTIQPPKDVKFVNGKKHEDLKSRDEVFTYSIETIIPKDKMSFAVIDTLVKELEIVGTPKVNLKTTYLEEEEIAPPKVVANGQEVKVTMNEKEISAYQGEKLVITFDAKIREGADITTYKDNKVPNKAVIKIDDVAKETDTVTVKPPSFTKKVNGQDNANLGEIDEQFTYTVDARVPNDIKELIITDNLEKVLEIVSVKLYNVTDKETITSVTPKVDGNFVKATFNEAEAKRYANKDVQLQIVAKIKDGADLSAFKDGKVPNEAILIVDDAEVKSNKVTVTPPNVNKTVNGLPHYTLGSQDEIVKYEVTAVIPSSAESFEITDALVQELEFVGTPTFSIKGIEPKVEGNKVSVKMNRTQVEANANKQVVLTFNARVVAGADLSPYADGKIPNKAVINNDGKVIETPTVTIQPPTDKKLVNGKTHVELAQRDEKFTYTIETIVPKDKNSFDLKDTLVDELEIVGTPKTSLKSEIVNGQTMNPPTPVVNGQDVSLHMNKQQLDAYGGQKLVLTIEAKIKDGANIATYKDNKVPNKAIITIDGKSKETNTVTVSPKVPTKTVDGKKHVTLEDKEQTFKYEVKYVIPQDAKKLVISDTLVKELEFIKDPQVNIKDVTAKVDGQTVTVELNATQIKENAGKELILSFESGIRHGADLSKYKDGNIPNVAKINVDDNPTVDTNTVTVSLPTLVKTINGTDFVRLAKDTDEFTYKLATKIPSNTKEFKLVDVVEDDIKVLGVDVNLRGFNAKVDGQKVTVEFTEGDLSKLAGQDLTVVIKAQLKNDYNIAKYKENKIPNVATMVTENGTVKSNTVHVSVDATKPQKTVNGVTDLTLLENREVFEYKVAVQIPQDAKSFTLVDELVKDLELAEPPTTNLEGVKPTVEGQKVTVALGETLIGQHGGKTLELRMKAQVKLNADLSIYDKGKVPNKALVNVDGNKYETNTVYVTPQVPVKTVDGKNHVNLEKTQQSFTYKIDVVVPQDAKDFTLTDKLVEELEVLETPKVNLDGVKASVNGQVVTVKLNEAEIKKYAGQKLSVSFLTGIKVGADLTRYKDGNIPNTAELKIDNKPVVKTNTVTVSAPQVVKYVNGQTGTVTLGKETDEFTYTVETVIPTGAKKFAVQDVLKDDIKVVSAETNLRGINANVNNQDVSINLTEAQIKEFEGQKIILTIKAKLKNDHKLEKYEDSKIPNTAVVTVDDKKITSNTVHVTMNKLELVKTVNGEKSIGLSSNKENFKYEVSVRVPADAKNFVLTDELVKELEIVGTPKVNLDDVKPTVNGNIVKVELGEKLTKQYANKTLVLTIEAGIRVGADVTVYEKNAVPNKATVKIDDKPVVNSNDVFVTVPQIDKFINEKKEDVVLNKKDDTFTYSIQTLIPANSKEIRISDVLAKELEIVEASVNFRDMEPKVDGNNVSIIFNERHIEAHANKPLILTIKAKFKDGADASAYEKNKLPNKATLQIGKGDVMESNTVYVTPSKNQNEVAISKTPISKTINGSTDVTLSKADETFTYEIKAPVPTSGKQFIVADELDKGLKFEGTGKVNLEGVDVKIKDQRIVVHLDEQLIKKYAGKDLILTFNAKLKADVKFAEYADGKIPNTALYQIDDKEVVKSNTVFVGVKDNVVTPSKETPPTKPNDPTKPSNPNNPSSPSNPSQPYETTSTTSKVLPQTGDAGFNYNMLFVGLALISLASVIGFYLFRRYRKMEQGEV